MLLKNLIIIIIKKKKYINNEIEFYKEAFLINYFNDHEKKFPSYLVYGEYDLENKLIKMHKKDGDLNKLIKLEDLKKKKYL